MKLNVECLKSIVLSLLTFMSINGWANDHEVDLKKTADVLYDESLLLIEAKKTSAAIGLLTQVVEVQPDHAGAWLDLAMLHCQEGNAAATRSLLDHIEQRFKPNPQLRLLINQIQRANCDGYAQQSSEIRLSQGSEIRVEFSLGVDDNVNQGLSNSTFLFNQGGNQIELQVAPGFRPRADEFAQADISYQKKGFSAFVQMRENLTEDEFDLLSVFVGYQSKPFLQGVNSQLGFLLGAFTLGGELYQRTQQINWYATPNALQSADFGTRLSMLVSRVDYPSLVGADAEFIEFGVENIWSQTDYSVITRVDYSLDNALRMRAGGDRAALGASLELLKPLPQNYAVRFSLAQKRTEGREIFSPGFINERRSQVRSMIGIALTKLLDSKTSLRLQIRKVINSENIELFEYDNTVVKVSVLWDFQ